LPTPDPGVHGGAWSGRRAAASRRHLTRHPPGRLAHALAGSPRRAAKAGARLFFSTRHDSLPSPPPQPVHRPVHSPQLSPLAPPQPHLLPPFLGLAFPPNARCGIDDQRTTCFKLLKCPFCSSQAMVLQLKRLDPRRTTREGKYAINELRKELGDHSSEAIKGFLSDATLSRFLRARNWNVQKASKMLKAAVKWRLAFQPENICWEDISEEAETGKIYRADYKDKLGRTVLVLRPGLENTTSGTGQIKYLVYSLEKAIMNLTDDQEKMVWLTDFQSWTLGSTPLKVTRETVNVLQDCYPERLGLAIYTILQGYSSHSGG
ncbi:hypothetical protein EJB05_32282, partial [Eragrostis curvula]